MVILLTEHSHIITNESLSELHTPKNTGTTAHVKSSQSSVAVACQRLSVADFRFFWLPELSPTSATSCLFLTTDTLNWFSHIMTDGQSVSLSGCHTGLSSKIKFDNKIKCVTLVRKLNATKIYKCRARVPKLNSVRKREFRILVTKLNLTKKNCL
jgi:hypothetical protein